MRDKLSAIPLGSLVTYRSSKGMMRHGRVVRKKEELKCSYDRKLKQQVEKAQYSLMLRIQHEPGDYRCAEHVNITQFKNILWWR